nr:MAG TPA: hypothetical protein [Caudoviricetes sp.]
MTLNDQINLLHPSWEHTIKADSTVLKNLLGDGNLRENAIEAARRALSEEHGIDAKIPTNLFRVGLTNDGIHVATEAPTYNEPAREALIVNDSQKPIGIWLIEGRNQPVDSRFTARWIGVDLLTGLEVFTNTPIC